MRLLNMSSPHPKTLRAYSICNLKLSYNYVHVPWHRRFMLLGERKAQGIQKWGDRYPNYMFDHYATRTRLFFWCSGGEFEL